MDSPRLKDGILCVPPDSLSALDDLVAPQVTGLGTPDFGEMQDMRDYMWGYLHFYNPTKLITQGDRAMMGIL